jgi:hypothetical protein
MRMWCWFMIQRLRANCRGQGSRGVTEGDRVGARGSFRVAIEATAISRNCGSGARPDGPRKRSFLKMVSRHRWRTGWCRSGGSRGSAPTGSTAKSRSTPPPPRRDDQLFSIAGLTPILASAQSTTVASARRDGRNHHECHHAGSRCHRHRRQQGSRVRDGAAVC